MDGLKSVVHTYSAHYPAMRKRNAAICNIDGTWGQYAKWKKADTETLNVLACMLNLKKLSLQKQRVEKWLPRVWGEGRRQNKDKSVNKYKVSVMQDEWVLEVTMYNLVIKTNKTVLYTWHVWKE